MQALFNYENGKRHVKPLRVETKAIAAVRSDLVHFTFEFLNENWKLIALLECIASFVYVNSKKLWLFRVKAE